MRRVYGGLLYVYGRRSADLFQSVARPLRLPVVHATEFVFELATSVGEVDFSLLRVERRRLHFQELVRERQYLLAHLRRNLIAQRGREVLQVLQCRDDGGEGRDLHFGQCTYSDARARGRVRARAA